MIQIFAEDCRDTMKKMKEKSVDVILTSPPYNTNAHARGKRVLSVTPPPWVHILMFGMILIQMGSQQKNT